MNNKKIELIQSAGCLQEFKDKTKELSLQEYLNMSLQEYKEYLFKNGALRYMPEKLSEYITENTANGYEYAYYSDIVLDIKTSDYEPNRDWIEHHSWWDNELNDYIHHCTVRRMITEEEHRINEANGEYDELTDEELDEPEIINENFDINRPERKIKLHKIAEYQKPSNDYMVNIIKYRFEYV